jgi:hypothetical protein
MGITLSEVVDSIDAGLVFSSNLSVIGEVSDGTVYSVATSLAFKDGRDGFLDVFGKAAGDIFDAVFDGDETGTAVELSGFFISDAGDLSWLDASFDEVSVDFGSAAAVLRGSGSLLGRVLLVDTLFARESLAGYELASRLIAETEKLVNADTTGLHAAPLDERHFSVHGIRGR